MSLLMQNKNVMRHNTVVVRCENNKRPNFNAKVNAFVEKKKELDRSRWEKLKEASRVIDHIAKSDVKETIEIFKSLVPPSSSTTASVDVEEADETTN